MELPHIVIIPSPGMGHLIPVVELAKLLHSRFSFSVSLLVPTLGPPTQAHLSFVGSLPLGISHEFLPPVDPAQLPQGSGYEATISLVLANSIPSMRASLGRLSRVEALITGLFGTDLFDVARELGIPPYMYFPCSAMNLLFSFRLPELDETVSCDYKDMPSPLVMPGCVPINGSDFDDPCQDRASEDYRVLLYHSKRYSLPEGILVNTFFDLEPGTIRALQMEDPSRPSVYPIGPILQSSRVDEEVDGSECLRWLDQQPTGSVLYVLFGSGATLSKEQLNELAIGLERSGLRFLWVVRSPNDQTFLGSSFRAHGQDDPFGFLPYGCFDRIKDRGLLVPLWAPQVKILGHDSTGGFLTHCGWNSVLESIVNGVPMIAWPLYAEQRMNAVMLNQGLMIALRPMVNANGLFEADEIARVVKDLMQGAEEGERIRYQVKELSTLAKKAIDHEDGDSSKSLAKVAHKLKANKSFHQD